MNDEQRQRILEEQEKQIAKEQIKEKEIVRAAATTQGTASLSRSNAAQQQNRTTTAQATRSIAQVIQGNVPQEQDTKPIRGVIQT